MASSSLCDDCLAVAKWLSSNPNRQAYNYPKDGSAVKRSSEECKLCRSMNWHFWWDHENITSIELNVERDWDDLISAIGITFRYDPKTFGHERLNVWVDEGNISSLLHVLLRLDLTRNRQRITYSWKVLHCAWLGRR